MCMNITRGYSNVCLPNRSSIFKYEGKIHTDLLNNMSSAYDVCERILFFDMRNK